MQRLYVLLHDAVYSNLLEYKYHEENKGVFVFGCVRVCVHACVGNIHIHIVFGYNLYRISNSCSGVSVRMYISTRVCM